MTRRLMRRLAPTLLLMLASAACRAAQLPCSLSISTLNFGTYTYTLLNGTANGTVACNSGSDTWNIAMNTGAGAGATETTRYMTGPNGVELAYKLFTNSARTTNWGDTTGNELTGAGTTTITVYGQIAAGQAVPSGTYTDTMTTATTSFTVTAVITASCTISAGNLSFGTYARTKLDATSTLTITCTNLAPFNIGLNAGTATGATVTTRKMTGPGGALLSYSLFRDSGYSLNWGQTVGTDTLASTGTGAAVQYKVYGQIPASQATTSGTYNDTIIATVTY
ncbi:MAG: spore coat protein U domain-containing protein [Terracidiphilus sp.]